MRQQSSIYGDVTYVRVPAQIWATLAVAKSPKSKTVRDAETVSVWGHKGKTTGVYGWMDMTGPGYLYLVPGYSGAFYVTIQEQESLLRFLFKTPKWLGMHLGAVTGRCTNVGARADVIYSEVLALEEEYTMLNPEGFRPDPNVEDGKSRESARNQAVTETHQRYDEQDGLLHDRVRSSYARTHRPTAEEELERYARSANAVKLPKQKHCTYEELKAQGKDTGFDELDEEALTSPQHALKQMFAMLDSEGQRDMMAVMTSMHVSPNTTFFQKAPGGMTSCLV